MNTSRLETMLHLEVGTTKSSLQKTWNILAQTPWDLKRKFFPGNLEVVYIGNTKLFCGNLRFLEKLGLKLDHFDQKMQVLDQIFTVNWFNLIKNVLFFLKVCLIRWDTFKNNLFGAKEYEFWWFVNFSLIWNRTKYGQIPSLCIGKWLFDSRFKFST